MSERLIDKIKVFDDFGGDPKNPEDLYEYFHRTGKKTLYRPRRRWRANYIRRELRSK